MLLFVLGDAIELAILFIDNGLHCPVDFLPASTGEGFYQNFVTRFLHGMELRAWIDLWEVRQD